mgnify:FL=1
MAINEKVMCWRIAAGWQETYGQKEPFSVEPITYSFQHLLPTVYNALNNGENKINHE